MRPTQPGLLFPRAIVLALLACHPGCDNRLPQVDRPDASRHDGGAADGAAVDAAIDDAASGSNIASPADVYNWPDQAGSSCSGLDKCSDEDFCELPDGCDSDSAGRCRPYPFECDDLYAPVCGCNGETYSSRCQAHADRQNVDHPGPCACPKIAQQYKQAVAEAKRCNPALSRLQCTERVPDSIVCGCPTAVEGPMDELERRLNDLVSAWEDEGCEQLPTACRSCPPEVEAHCRDSGSGTGSGTCADQAR